MIYPESFEQRLGFDHIRIKLKDYCHSPAGEEWVDRMRFSTEPEFIKTLLKTKSGVSSDFGEGGIFSIPILF